MKKHRIFIAINFPDKAKKKLQGFQDLWSSLPVKWTKKYNLHLTLLFIGDVDDGEIYEICKIAKKTAAKYEPFLIKFNKILLGPPGKQPRMFWVEGEYNKELTKLRNEIEMNFEKSENGAFNNQENRAFRPHVTLGRIHQGEWKQLAEKPVVEKTLSLSIAVNSIEIMESILSRKGPDYIVLDSIELGY